MMIMQYISTFLFSLKTFLVFGQVDTNLSKQVDSLVAEDQKWRIQLRQVNNNEIDTISRDIVNIKIRTADSLNFLQIKKLFDKYGYLGYDKIGKESSHNFWLLVQHADVNPEFQNSVLAKMKIEVNKENASNLDYAYLVDRVKVNTGQLQIFGTQLTINSTGTSYEAKPCIEPDKLNERRKQVGLPTIEVYIKQMNEICFGTLKKNDPAHNIRKNK